MLARDIGHQCRCFIASIGYRRNETGKVRAARARPLRPASGVAAPGARRLGPTDPGGVLEADVAERPLVQGRHLPLRPADAALVRDPAREPPTRRVRRLAEGVSPAPSTRSAGWTWGVPPIVRADHRPSVREDTAALLRACPDPWHALFRPSLPDGMGRRRPSGRLAGTGWRDGRRAVSHSRRSTSRSSSVDTGL